LLDSIDPFEIKDTNKIGKKNLIFKEIFYVRKTKLFKKNKFFKFN
jgi:hypothetical protein